MVEHVTRTVKVNLCNVLVGKAKGKTLFGQQSYKMRIILKWILKKYDQGRVMFIRGTTRTRIFCCGRFSSNLEPIKWMKILTT